MKKLICLDDLERRCGYSSTTRNGEANNNGYGCTHRGNKETPGECHSYSCPVAVEADYEEILEIDPELAKEYENEQQEHGWIESDWMVVWRPYYIKKIFGEVT